MGTERQWALAYPTPSPPSSLLGGAVFEYGSYSLSYSHVLVYSQKLFIRIIRFKIFGQICIQIFDMMQKNTCCSEYLLKIFWYWRIFASKYLFRSEYLQNCEFHIKAYIRLQIFAYWQIFACKYSHTSKYSLRIASNYLEKPFTSPSPQSIFGSFWKYSPRKEIRFCFYSHVKSADSLRSKWIKPVLLSSKRINIRLYSLRTEYRGAP